MKRVFILSCVLGLVGCSSGEQSTKRAKEENVNNTRAIKEIIEYYGGKVEVEEHFQFGNRIDEKTYILLTLEGSNTYDKRTKINEIAPSNIAYLYFRNMSESSIQKMDELRVKIVDSQGNERLEIFDMSLLRRVEEKMDIPKVLIDKLKAEDFEGIEKMLDIDSLAYGFGSDLLVGHMQSFTNTFGDVDKGFEPLGFYVYVNKSGKRVFHISGMVDRIKLDHEFYVEIDTVKDENKVLMVDYEL